MSSALINLSAVIDTIGGTANAPLRFTGQVMRGGQPAIRVAGAQATVPAAIVAYWNGTAWAPQQPTLTDVDVDCYWQVELAKPDGTARLARNVVLPAGHSTSINFGDLTIIDPSTLVPSPAAAAGWAATQALALQVKASFDALVAGAPSALDTFLEIATEFATDETGLAALTAALAAKADAAAVAATYQALRDVQATATTGAALALNKHNPLSAASGAQTFTLPTPSKAGDVITAEREDSTTANALAITGNIRGSASSYTLAGQYEGVRFEAKADGSWWVTGDHKTKTWLDSIYRSKVQEARNILDYGVSTGTSTTQTAAIKAALDAHPGDSFYFPPGDYRFDTGLVIGQGNSLILDDGARFYAAAAMTTLVTYAWAGSGYAEDKAFIGGTLDGALLANRLLSIATVLHFTLTRTKFRDGINRGLVTESGPGAEIFAYDLRFKNTTTSNVSDNIAIEAKMGDSHFRDISMRDWTVAVKDTASNRWDRIHPWIGPDASGVTQMTSRYPTSIGFDITGPSDLQACVADTYNIAYKSRTNGTGSTGIPRLLNCRAMWADTPTLPTALANANPGYVLDNSDGIGFLSDRLTVNGPPSSPTTFLLGAATNLTTRNTFSYGYIKGYTGAVSTVLDYISGRVQGTFTFSPTFVGSTGVGTHSYTNQVGRMIVVGDLVTYTVRLSATLDSSASFSGSLRIGGMPLPQGSTNVRRGGAGIGDYQNLPVAAAMIPDGTSAQIWLQMVASNSTGAIDIVTQSMRGKTVDITLTITLTHF